jgi:hypothetical protein
MGWESCTFLYWHYIPGFETAWMSWIQCCCLCSFPFPGQFLDITLDSLQSLFSLFTLPGQPIVHQCPTLRTKFWVLTPTHGLQHPLLKFYLRLLDSDSSCCMTTCFNQLHVCVNSGNLQCMHQVIIYKPYLNSTSIFLPG